MSVASKNPFAALGDGDEPVAAAPKAAPASTPAAAAAPRRAIVGAGGQAQRNPAASNEAGRGRGGNRGAPRNPAPAGEDGEAPERDVRSSRGRGEGRGGRGGRGAGRGGRGRAFDRHSQTARVDTDKTVHQGWGGDDGKRELEVEEGAKADAAAEGTSTPANGEATPSKEASTPAPVEEEEVDNTKTLDEYLADLASKKASLGAGAKELRKAEHTEDWEGFGQKVLKNQQEEAYFAPTTKDGPKRTRERKEKQTLEIDQTFSSPAVASSGRGGRGGTRGGERGGRGGRGRGERGAPRGAPRGTPRGAPRNGAGANVNLADNSAFPALG